MGVVHVQHGAVLQRSSAHSAPPVGQGAAHSIAIDRAEEVATVGGGQRRDQPGHHRHQDLEERRGLPFGSADHGQACRRQDDAIEHTEPDVVNPVDPSIAVVEPSDDDAKAQQPPERPHREERRGGRERNPSAVPGSGSLAKSSCLLPRPPSRPAHGGYCPVSRARGKGCDPNQIRIRPSGLEWYQHPRESGPR